MSASVAPAWLGGATEYCVAWGYVTLVSHLAGRIALDFLTATNFKYSVLQVHTPRRVSAIWPVKGRSVS
jgi:hypothetical protein